MESKGPFPFKILVDQGEADKFLNGARLSMISLTHGALVMSTCTDGKPMTK